MIRVSPGVGLPGAFTPAREVRTSHPAESSASFDDALTGVETPTPPANDRVRPQKRDDERAHEAPDNTDGTTPAHEVDGAPHPDAPTDAHEGADVQPKAGADETPKHTNDVGKVRTAGADVEAGSQGVARSAPGVLLPGSGPIQVPTRPDDGAIKSDGAPVAGATVPAAHPPKGEPAPEQPPSDEVAPRPRHGNLRPGKLDGIPERVWPKHIGEPKPNDRPTPSFAVESAPDVAPEGAATIGPVPGERFPVVRAQEVSAGTDARIATGTGSEGGAQVTPGAASTESNGSHAKGDGPAPQWRGESSATPSRPVERTESAPQRVEVGGAPGSEGAQEGPGRIGVEQLGVGLGRAVGAPRTAPGSAGSAPQADRAGGFEGAVMRGFSAVMRQNGGSVVIRLSPESLGPVRIAMSLDSTSLSVMLDASTPKAHELLSQSLGSLRQSLEAQGMRVERMGVTLSQPHPAGPGPVADGAAHQRGSEDSGFGDQDAADGRSRGHADQESRDRHGGAHGDPTHPFGTFSELVESSGTSLRFVATA